MDALFDKVLESAAIQVPQDQVDDEVNRLVIELNHRMRYESLATGAYPVLTPEEQAERLEEIKADAFKRVKTRLVLDGIIAAEKFSVTQEELEEEAQAISLRQQMPVEMVKDFLGTDLAPLKDDLLVRKAFDFVLGSANFQAEKPLIQ